LKLDFNYLSIWNLAPMTNHHFSCLTIVVESQSDQFNVYWKNSGFIPTSCFFFRSCHPELATKAGLSWRRACGSGVIQQAVP
ncbi:hypothetical protein MXD63_42270, partial [Frankia sp. Cpl3]|nr:hypothetical protein [Frankia sp. Cpl3]